MTITHIGPKPQSFNIEDATNKHELPFGRLERSRLGR